MPKFSKRSQDRLNTCHPDLQKVFNEVIKYFDCSIIEGIRTKETQEEYVRTGKSRTMNSRHLDQGDGYSHAVDVAPFVKTHPNRIPWDDHRYFFILAGHVQRIAAELGVELRWGGDWDSDGNLSDQTFIDLPHWELPKK